MKSYQYNQEFLIKYCDADFKDDMKISTALALMEEGASCSADELGFGYTYIRPKGYAFIISNSCIEFFRPIRVGEGCVLQTWPNIPSFAVFERQYRFVDEKGNSVACAASRWCLIDVQSGKILPSKCIDNQDYSTYRTDKALEDVQWKIKAFEMDGEAPRFQMTVAVSDYDHNMHVNNTRYADYCMNVFTVEELKTKWVRRFSISYLKPCREGDTLSFYRKALENDVFLVQGVNALGETVVRAQITFTEIER